MKNFTDCPDLHVTRFADFVSATRGTRPLPLDPLPSSLFRGTAEHHLEHGQSLSQNRAQKFHLISVPRQFQEQDPCHSRGFRGIPTIG